MFKSCALAMAFAALAAGSVFAAVPLSDQAPAAGVAESDVAAFRRLRAEAMTAITADDLDAAAGLLAQADARIPNHPGLILLRARVAAARGDAAQAVVQLHRYGRAGLSMNLARDQALSAVAGAPGFAEAAGRLEANRAPIGADRLSVVAVLEGAGLVESLARDAAGEGWLVSRVAGRDIVRLADDGDVTPWLQAEGPAEGVLGLAPDPSRGLLWAAVSPAPPAAHGREDVGPAALLAIHAATGQVGAAYPLAADGREHGLGDLTLDAEGAVYVSDGLSGEIYRLPPAGEALEVFVAAGRLGSPQGLALTPDGQALVVADYSSGLWHVARAGGEPVRMAAPDDAVLIGIDGLISDGRSLYALQNGVSPQRVLKLTPNPAWTRIDQVQVLAANLPQIAEPTTGLILDGDLVFVARSQWSDFAADGSLRTPAPDPAIIARLRLD